MRNDDLVNSSEEMYETEIPLSQLLLDEGNFRIDEVDNQREAVFALLRQQREGEKIHNLAKHIVEHGRLAPGERLLVIRDDDQPVDAVTGELRYIVMEGNRRVTALKLLEHPPLIKESFPRLYNQFLGLSEGFPLRLRTGIPCVVLPDRETALNWVEIKHSTELDGVGFEKWDAMATARVSERRGRYRRWRIALSRLEAAGVDTTAIRAGIQDKTTAVERVLNSRAIRDTLGLVFRNNQGTVTFENGDEASGVKLLNELLRAMAEPEFRTGKVHALDDREAFVQGLEALAVKAVAQDEGDQRNSAGSSSPGGRRTGGGTPPGENGTAPNEDKPGGREKPVGKHPLRSSVDRKYLAPRERGQTFHVAEPALNSLYLELRKLQVRGLAKTAAVLTRVFLEMSCDSYLEQLVPVPDHFSHRGIKRWADGKLREKVEAVLKDLDPKGKQPELSLVRKALGGDDWLHSIDTLHEFVHSHLASVTESEAKLIWDRYQPFLKTLHDRIYDGM